MAVGSSLLDRPSVTWRTLRTAWLVVRLRCPSCGLGRMAAGRLAIHPRCAVCGVVFERDPGEVAGGIWVNSMAATLGICGLAIWLEFFTSLPRALVTPVVVGFAAVFPIAFYRHSRAIWIGVLHVAGLVHRDEAADPEPVIKPWPPEGPRGGGPAAARALGLLALLLAGCASHPLSEPLREAAKDQPPFTQLASDPARYVGETVVLSGVVLGAFPGPDGGTVLEVLQVPAGRSGRPEEPDRSEGRFLAVHAKRLDPAVYAPGRRVAVGGEIVRAETRALPGGGTIIYPVVEARELHLFPAERRAGGLPVNLGIGIGIGF